MFKRALFVIPLLFACTPSREAEVLPGLPPFALDASEVRAIAEGALSHAELPEKIRAAGAIEMRLVGSDAPLPRAAAGVRLLPFDAPAEHDFATRGELAITDRIGDELFVELRVLNPIGGPTVTAMRFTHLTGRWVYAETVSVDEYL